MFAALDAVQRIYGVEDLEKKLHLLNLSFLSIKGYFLSVMGFIILVTSTCFISAPVGLDEIYSTIKKGRIKTTFKKKILFFKFLHAYLALHTKNFQGKQ